MELYRKWPERNFEHLLTRLVPFQGKSVIMLLIRVLSVSLAVMQQSAAEKERGRSGQFGKRKITVFSSPSFNWTRFAFFLFVKCNFVSSKLNSGAILSTYRNICSSRTSVHLFSTTLLHHTDNTTRFRSYYVFIVGLSLFIFVIPWFVPRFVPYTMS